MQSPSISGSAAVALEHPGCAMRRKVFAVPAVRPLDVFFALNAVLFTLMCGFAYFDRWIAYMGAGSAQVAEFLCYAIGLMGVIVLIWAVSRRLHFPTWLLVLMQIGLLAHFSGGLLYFEGARLYDHRFGAVRYDKWVHLMNSFFAALFVQELCRMRGLPMTGFVRVLACGGALGLGCLVEIAEFAVTCTIPHHGVGGYNDNMRDIIANAGGAGLFLCGTVIFAQRQARR